MRVTKLLKQCHDEFVKFYYLKKGYFLTRVVFFHQLPNPNCVFCSIEANPTKIIRYTICSSMKGLFFGGKSDNHIKNISSAPAIPAIRIPIFKKSDRPIHNSPIMNKRLTIAFPVRF